jgi:hypothetical protein
MQAWILGGLIASASHSLLVEYQVTGGKLDAGANSVTIGFGANQKNFEPMV